jgi:hypothetical protein
VLVLTTGAPGAPGGPGGCGGNLRCIFGNGGCGGGGGNFICACASVNPHAITIVRDRALIIFIMSRFKLL